MIRRLQSFEENSFNKNWKNKPNNQKKKHHKIQTKQTKHTRDGTKDREMGVIVEGECSLQSRMNLAVCLWYLYGVETYSSYVWVGGG